MQTEKKNNDTKRQKEVEAKEETVYVNSLHYFV